MSSRRLSNDRGVSCWRSVAPARISLACGSFPAGRSRRASQPQALQRELEEELGLACQVSDYVASSTLLQPGRRIHLHAWRVQPDAGEPQAREHAALHWVTPQQALDYPLAPADLPLLQAYLARLARFARDA